MKAVLFVAGIVMLTVACNKKDDGPTLDFDITVPSDWNYYIYSNEGLVFNAVSPQANDSDRISENLLVWKVSAENTTLQSFYSSYATSLAKDTTYHAISITDTTINGEEAIKLTHLQTVDAINTSNSDTIHLNAKIQKYVMVSNNYGYVVSFNALTSTFNQYKVIFDNIIATFMFKK